MSQEPVSTKGKDGWCAGVFRKDGRLFYHFPVTSGFADFAFQFEISQKHLQILQTDEERFYFLFAVLHEKHQLEPFPTEAERDEIVETILFADQDTVSEYLTNENTGAHVSGGISNFAGQFLGWAGQPRELTDWFAVKDI